MARFCENCGTEMSGTATFCSSCGSKISAPASVHAGGGSAAAAQPARSREEHVIFNEAGISVTSARLISGSQTFAMSGITSVKMTVSPPSKLWPIIVILAGALMTVSALAQKSPVGGVLVSIAIAAVGILWLISKKPTYAVRLASASGETEAYLSKDQNLVAKIVKAVNEAIVHRG